MMDFMDSLKRGVDRAGFEVDRLLRANRVRSHINALRSQVEEETRQIGRQVMEIYDRGEPLQEQLGEHCERIKQFQAEIAQRETELEAINREVPPPVQPTFAADQPEAARCPNCGAALPEEAVFCPRCGVSVKAAHQAPPAAEQPGPGREEVKQDVQDAQDKQD